MVLSEFYQCCLDFTTTGVGEGCYQLYLPRHPQALSRLCAYSSLPGICSSRKSVGTEMSCMHCLGKGHGQSPYTWPSPSGFPGYLFSSVFFINPLTKWNQHRNPSHRQFLAEMFWDAIHTGCILGSVWTGCTGYVICVGSVVY